MLMIQKTSRECDLIYTLYTVKYCIKYALIHNIGGRSCLLCHLLHFRRFSGHFVEPTLYLYHLILPGTCDAGRS